MARWISGITNATDKYKDISSNPLRNNILFYQHPYNKIIIFVQF